MCLLKWKMTICLLHLNTDQCNTFVVCMFDVIAGRCRSVIPRGAGKVSYLWRSPEEAVCFPANHRPTVCNFSHKQQSTVGSGGLYNMFSKVKPECVFVLFLMFFQQENVISVDMFWWFIFAMFFHFVITRWFIMTHVEEVQATGTACSGLNI